MNRKTSPGREHEALFAAVSFDETPRRPSPLKASLVFGWRALLKMKHVPEQLLDVTVFPVMFILLFTYLFGGALAGSTDQYIQFLLPGILVQSVVFVTVYTGFGLNTDISKGFFDRLRSLPVWQPSAVVGALLGDSLRYAAASVLTIGVGLLLGFRPGGGLLGVLVGVAVLLIFSFSLSWIWTMLGLILRSPNSVMGVSMMILFPLTFASNIFVDPATMPPWLQAFVAVNPVSIVVTAVRESMHGMYQLSVLIPSMIFSALLVAVFAPVTMFLYHRKH